MSDLSITPNLDLSPWSDLPELADVERGTVERVGLLPHGMASGDPTFELVIRLPDGTRISACAPWRLMSLAVRSLDVSPIAPKLADRP